MRLVGYARGMVLIDRGRCAGQARGFTLLELVIAAFVIAVVFTGLFGLLLLTMRSAHDAERRVVAVALANERVELVRNLPYVQVGTVGGVPAGPLLQSESVERNGTTYAVRTDIRYVDDLFDGAVGGRVEEDEQMTICHHPPGGGAPQTLVIGASAWPAHQAHGDTAGSCEGGPGTGTGDEYNADYKQVRVEVSWVSPYAPKPVLLITYVVPDGVEGGEVGGTLDFQALNAAGAGVSPATVRLVNEAAAPAIDLTTQTNAEGRVVLPGLPPASGAYELSVSRSGYTGEQTYDTTASFIPDADHVHLTIIGGEVTSKTFFIDEVSSLELSFEEGGTSAQDFCGEGPGQGQGQGQGNTKLSGIAYELRGTKTIGTDGAGEPVYVVDEAGVSGANGRSTHEELVWDGYDMAIDGAAVGCDIKETSVPLAMLVAAGEEAELTVRLVRHTAVSLQVAVVDASGAPIDNATVHLAAGGYDETLATGVWGQVLFADLPAEGEYTLEVAAPGYTDFVDALSVAGTSRTRVLLAVS